MKYVLEDGAWFYEAPPKRHPVRIKNGRMCMTVAFPFGDARSGCPCRTVHDARHRMREYLKENGLDGCAIEEREPAEPVQLASGGMISQLLAEVFPEEREPVAVTAT